MPGLAMAAEQAAASGSEGGYWQLALILAAIGFLGMFARWRKMRPPVVTTAKEMRARDEDPNRYRDAADRAIVELLETSRSLNAQVDTKIRMLNRLVKEAEEQCARLENLIALSRGLPPEGALDEETVQFVPETGRRKSAHDGRTGPIAGAEPRPAGHSEKAAEKEGPRFLSDLHERIYRLREDGKTVAEIAKATNLSTTEVEFIVKSF